MDTSRQSVECDVLVVGAAAAGLTAAIEARDAGASVAVVTKGNAGRSGNTMVAGPGFSAVIPYEGSTDSPEQHFQDIMVGGRGINDERLVRILVEQGGRQVMKLRDWGVPIIPPDPGRKATPGHSMPRGNHPDFSAYPNHLRGLSITEPLAATARRKGVRLLDQTPVIRLAMEDGAVVGATAVDLEGGGLLSIRARAVVMAAGGAGRLYPRHNNAGGITGDAYGLMLQAGAVLRDMEFVQFYPIWMTTPFKAGILPSLLANGAVLRNRHGERFMHRYDPVHGDIATRDVMSQAIFHEVRKGNGVDGQVYVDCTALSNEAWERADAPLRRNLTRHGIDPAKDWPLAAPLVHFFMGGAEIDGECRTSVPGLFAAGEAAGGVRGANRLGGNALTETVVFGPIAGRTAAAYARTRSVPSRIALSPTPDTGTGRGESLDAVRQELRQAMWDGAAVIRSAESLGGSLSAVERCAAALGNPPATASERARWEETRLMCLVAKTVAASALAREESRGAHYREDFPEAASKWLGSHRVRLIGDKLQVEFAPKPLPVG